MVCCLVIEEIFRIADRMIKGSGDLPLPDKAWVVCISGISVNNEEAQKTTQSGSLQLGLSLKAEVVLFLECSIDDPQRNY